MAIKELRGYQGEIIRLTRDALRQGFKRPMIKAPTGSGKGLIAAEIIKMARAKGNKVNYTIPAISLVDQAVSVLAEHGIHDVGVIQAQHELSDFTKPVQICSVDTLSRRRNYPIADFMLIDEAHRNSQFIFKWMEKWKKIPFIGMSATPWTKGLGKHYDCLINIIGTKELIDMGYLCDFEVYSPSAPDLKKVKTVMGDWDQKELGKRSNKDPLIADIVEQWLARAENRPTICYAVDRAHAASIQKKFQQAGVPCGYIDAFTELPERMFIKQELAAGRIKIVVNIGCLTTGIDWDVRCLILAVSTKSIIKFVQIVGRGLRTNPDGMNCLILDHSDTHNRLGMVTGIDQDYLDDGKTKISSEPEPKEKMAKTCPNPECKFLKEPGVHECPKCGFAPEKQSDVQTMDGQLVRLKSGDIPKSKLESHEERVKTYSMLLYYSRSKGYKDGWAYYATQDRCNGLPKNQNDIQPVEPDPVIKDYITHLNIRRAYSRKKKSKSNATSSVPEYLSM